MHEGTDCTDTDEPTNTQKCVVYILDAYKYVRAWLNIETCYVQLQYPQSDQVSKILGNPQKSNQGLYTSLLGQQVTFNLFQGCFRTMEEPFSNLIVCLNH